MTVPENWRESANFTKIVVIKYKGENVGSAEKNTKPKRMNERSKREEN